MPDDFCAEPVSCGGWRPLGCAAIAIVTASSCVGARTFPAPLAGALDCTRAAEQIARVAKSCGDEDLSFIGTLVGDARIVALGESDHGDGSALRLKAKIAKYLITQRGFDVLDWESGTWDVDRMATQLREGVPAGDAATAGLFPNFAKNRDVRDLLSWTVSSEQKILLFGFDPQSLARIAARRSRRSSGTSPTDMRSATSRFAKRSRKCSRAFRRGRNSRPLLPISAHLTARR